jgi:hypothetical protein
MKIRDIKNLPDMYKNCGLTCILVVQELTNLSTENISMQSNAEVADSQPPLSSYASNKIPSKGTFTSVWQRCLQKI